MIQMTVYVVQEGEWGRLQRWYSVPFPFLSSGPVH